MIKMLGVLIVLILVFTVLTGCVTGYAKQNGSWVWVTNDEQFGSRTFTIVGADQSSFYVLDNKNFAKDKESVYFKGKKIPFADPHSFTCLSANNYAYSRDFQFVFFEDERIINADPKTFEVLSFPYARDAKDVFCGTLPMMLTKDEVSTFKVVNQDETMAGMITRSKLNHFVEYNEKYMWLKRYENEMNRVIVGEWGEGRSASKIYKGLYAIDLK